MELKRIFDKVITRSGQFLINSNKLELNIERFRDLVEDALARYSSFVPYTQIMQMKIMNPRTVTFTDAFIQAMTGKPYLGVPDMVTDVTPVRLTNIHPYALFKNLDPNHNPEIMDKAQVPWVWRKPSLTVPPYAAEWEIHMAFRHRIFEEEMPDGSYKYSVPTIDPYSDEIFLKYVQGLFLQGIGRSRRAFTLNDLPITMDADAIIAEGKEMEDQALEQMENQQKFHLAWG